MKPNTTTTEAASAVQEATTVTLLTPAGVPIIGTIDTIPGIAHFDNEDVPIGADGFPDVSEIYAGDTDVCWEAQGPERALNGSPIYQCEDGEEWVWDKATGAMVAHDGRTALDEARDTLLEAREALHNMRRDFERDDCANGDPMGDACPCTLHRIRRTLLLLGCDVTKEGGSDEAVS